MRRSAACCLRSRRASIHRLTSPKHHVPKVYELT